MQQPEMTLFKSETVHVTTLLTNNFGFSHFSSERPTAFTCLTSLFARISYSVFLVHIKAWLLECSQSLPFPWLSSLYLSSWDVFFSRSHGIDPGSCPSKAPSSDGPKCSALITTSAITVSHSDGHTQQHSHSLTRLLLGFLTTCQLHWGLGARTASAFAMSPGLAQSVVQCWSSVSTC